MDKISKIIKQSRLVLRYNQQNFSKNFNMTKYTLSRYENGVEAPQGTRLIEILEFISKKGIDLNTLFDERIKTKPKT